MAHLIPPEYHPEKAERKEEVGSFDLYHFEGGAKLLLRRNAVEKVFDTKWEEKRGIPAEELVLEYRLGKAGAIVRFLDSRLAIAGNSPEKFLANYRKMLAARVRFETPAAWLEMPKRLQPRNHIIVTRFNDVKKPLKNVLLELEPEKVDKLFQNAARELGKMHGAGIIHGHPHVGNILVDEKGNISFIDPKLITSTNKPIAPITPKETNPLLRNTFDGQIGPLEENDLQWLYCKALALTCVDWKKVNAQYKRGREEGKRRIEKAKL